MEKPFFKTYYDPLYFAFVEVMVCSRDDANAYFKKKKYNISVEEYHAGTTVSLVKDGKTKYLIWMMDHYTFYALVHELIHLTRWIFINAGVPFGPDNDEGIAYYQGYWLKKIWNDLGRINDQTIANDKKKEDVEKVKRLLKSGGEHD